MISQNVVNHFRAIRCALTIHRCNPIETFKTWRQWQDGLTHLYDEHGYIA